MDINVYFVSQLQSQVII